MKKSLLLLGASLFALAACSVPDSSESSSSSYYPDFSDNPWGVKAASDCYDNVKGVIPYLACDSFDYTIGIDDYGDPMMTFYLYYSTDELATQAFTDYAHLCAEKWYAVNVGQNTYIDPDTYSYYVFDVFYADCLVEKNLGLEIVGTTSTHEEKPCLGLFVYNYLYVPKEEYPELAVQEILGKDHGIPQIVGDGYEYEFMFSIESDYNSKCVEIAVLNCGYDVEEWFFNELIKDYWYIMACDDSAETYERVKEYPGITYGSYYYATNNDAIVIFEYNFDKNAFIIDIFQRPADM